MTILYLLIILLIAWNIYLTYELSHAQNKIKEVFELSIKHSKITTNHFLVYLKQLGVLNDRQADLFTEELEEKIKNELKTERQLNEEYKEFRKDFIKKRHMNNPSDGHDTPGTDVNRG